MLRAEFSEWEQVQTSLPSSLMMMTERQSSAMMLI